MPRVIIARTLHARLARFCFLMTHESMIHASCLAPLWLPSPFSVSTSCRLRLPSPARIAIWVIVPLFPRLRHLPAGSSSHCFPASLFLPSISLVLPPPARPLFSTSTTRTWRDSWCEEGICLLTLVSNLLRFAYVSHLRRLLRFLNSLTSHRESIYLTSTSIHWHFREGIVCIVEREHKFRLRMMANRLGATSASVSRTDRHTATFAFFHCFRW